MRANYSLHCKWFWRILPDRKWLQLIIFYILLHLNDLKLWILVWFLIIPQITKGPKSTGFYWSIHLQFFIISHCMLFLALLRVSSCILLILFLPKVRKKRNIFSNKNATHSEYIAGQENAFWMIFTAHVIGWIAQFIGHGVFEGRKPALMDNLLQGMSHDNKPGLQWGLE